MLCGAQWVRCSRVLWLDCDLTDLWPWFACCPFIPERGLQPSGKCSCRLPKCVSDCKRPMSPTIPCSYTIYARTYSSRMCILLFRTRITFPYSSGKSCVQRPDGYGDAVNCQRFYWPRNGNGRKVARGRLNDEDDAAISGHSVLMSQCGNALNGFDAWLYYIYYIYDRIESAYNLMDAVWVKVECGHSFVGHGVVNT